MNREGSPMLVLTRGVDQSVLIGDDIVVTVVDIGGNKVRIGIDAPPDLLIDRDEVRERRIAEALPGPLETA